MVRLVLNCEGADLVTHELVRDIVLTGRAPLNQIVIDHPTVSGQHAIFLKVGDTYWLKDLNSTNGTQANDVFVADAELKDGDTIRFWFGDSGLRRTLRQTMVKLRHSKIPDEYFGLS
jgi:pSer/pThr/pTyr-binding forkhead associated (FHA) protein